MQKEANLLLNKLKIKTYSELSGIFLNGILESVSNLDCNCGNFATISEKLTCSEK